MAATGHALLEGVPLGEDVVELLEDLLEQPLLRAGSPQSGREVRVNGTTVLTLGGVTPEAPDLDAPIESAFGLAGRKRDAAQVARMDLDARAVRANLAYYATLRALSDSAQRVRAVHARYAGR